MIGRFIDGGPSYFSPAVSAEELPAPSPTPPPFDGVLRPNGKGRLDAYLSPPFVSSHASMVEQTSEGRLHMAWFSGSQVCKERASQHLVGPPTCAPIGAPPPCTTWYFATADEGDMNGGSRGFVAHHGRASTHVSVEAAHGC